MSERVVGETDTSGRAVARKRATTAPQRACLAWEAEVLDAARHPGVVELLAIGREDDDEVVELTTTYVGTHSLATCGPLPGGRAATVLASVAATVADLHTLGIAHRRLEPTHVLIAHAGRPVLCGLSGATICGRSGPPTSPVPAEFVDPAAPLPAASAPAGDVFGLGALLAHVIRGGGRRSPPAGRRRLLPTTPAALREAMRRRALVRLAERAMSPEPGFRPTAAAMAAALHAVARHVPPADPSTAPTQPTPSRHRHIPWGKALAGGCTLALLVIAGSVLAGPMRPVEPEPGATTTPVASGSTTTVPPTTPTPQIVGDNMVELGGERLEVGAPGDQILLGDWDCDGAATVALFRPASGDVFVFDAWAEPGRPATVRSMARVAGAVRALSDPAGACPTLFVELADGSRVEVGPS